MASSNSALSSLRYPYPNDVNVSDFVHVMLSEQNYSVWRELMLRLIKSQGLDGFIDVEVSASHHGDRVEKDNNDDVHGFTIPKRQEMENQQDWKRSDALLQRWIIRTISEDVLPHVVHLETANAMWLTLKFLYGRNKEYPYPVEVNVGNFVPIKLSGENPWPWAKMMHRLIKRQGLLNFINGEVPAPPKKIRITDENSSPNSKKEFENPDYKAWKRTDDLLQSWIIGLIDDKDLLECLERLETAQKIWTKLIEVFNLLYFRKKVRDEETEEVEDPISQYMVLLKAARTGDWAAAKEFITKKPAAKEASITRQDETALMIAVRSARGNYFVKKFLEEFMKPEEAKSIVALQDKHGWTALHYAAMAGNTEAAKFLVKKNRGLPNICSKVKWSPLRVAAIYGGRKMVEYLLDVTKDNVDPKQFEGEIGGALVKSLILAGLYDIALLLIRRYPKLAWEENSVLQNIAFNSSSAFKSGAHLNRCQNLIFRLVPTKLEAAYYFCGSGDIENSTNSGSLSVQVKQQLYYVMWKVILKLVPQVKYIQEIKMKHEQALDLVKHICSNTSKLTHSKVEIMQRSLLYAANFGIPEVVEEIIDSFPELAYCTNEMGQNIFQVAVLNRCESVFNLIYQFREGVRHHILTKRDSNNKSCLQLVVNLKKEQKLNLRASAAGAALQMQRELQWFKEVEKHTIIYYKEYRKRESTTSGRIYTEAHEELVKEGEKWMKDTATSCTIIAALVAMVVFSAAITVPGGYDGENGLPILFQNKAFIFFIIADAIALFSSISSVLMFLAILTSRYSVNDFLFTLPNRLIIGLITLFVSIISMMIAFGAILYLLFANYGTWILIPIILFSCFPVTLFWISQSPLLLDMMLSTYGSGIFHQQSNRILL